VDEVRLALENGYRILVIYQVYETGEGGLFVDYINIFLKLKAEATGYPGWIQRPEDKEQYVETFGKNEGIRLDRESIKSNAAKRCLTKTLPQLHVGETERKERQDAD